MRCIRNMVTTSVRCRSIQAARHESLTVKVFLNRLSMQSAYSTQTSLCKHAARTCSAHYMPRNSARTWCHFLSRWAAQRPRDQAWAHMLMTPGHMPARNSMEHSRTCVFSTSVHGIFTGTAERTASLCARAALQCSLSFACAPCLTTCP